MYGWLITKVMSARYGNEEPVKIWFRHLRLVKGRKEIEEMRIYSRKICRNYFFMMIADDCLRILNG